MIKDTYIKGVATGGGGGSVGAKLMKTNQTISFATGDDGDLQQGRLNSFFILNSNSVFGTNERFTDELGTQVYANRIIIDHSTDNGTEILGYYNVRQGADVWADAVANALLLSVSTFTSGWRLTNFKELLNLFKIGNRAMNYSPINQGVGNNRYWTSTTLEGYSNQPYFASNAWQGGGVPATQSYEWLGCRNFTYSDLGVTGAINPIVGAKLMKTGQTISYATNDDGDLQEGRDVDFYTLASNNPFGNTDRFTDELGGSTYSNDIVIDWSTYGGTTVIGWSRLVVPSTTWANHITNATAYSIGSFTSGWRLPNVLEMMSICKYDNVSTGLNYTPFNVTSTGSFSTSTTYRVVALSNSFNYIFGFSTGQLQANNKVNNTYSIRCRTFTVTGTTLT